MGEERSPRWVIFLIALILLSPCCVFLAGAGGALALDMWWHPATQLLGRGAPESPRDPGQGTRPPSAASEQDALPHEVGAFALEAGSTRKPGTFYGIPVEHDAAQAAYQGAQAEVTLTLIRTQDEGTAADYVNGVIAWLEGRSGIRITRNHPQDPYAVFMTGGVEGSVWNSKNWVISIHSSSQEARNEFRDALPYE